MCVCYATFSTMFRLSLPEFCLEWWGKIPDEQIAGTNFKTICTVVVVKGWLAGLMKIEEWTIFYCNMRIIKNLVRDASKIMKFLNTSIHICLLEHNKRMRIKNDCNKHLCWKVIIGLIRYTGSWEMLAFTTHVTVHHSCCEIRRILKCKISLNVPNDMAMLGFVPQINFIFNLFNGTDFFNHLNLIYIFV